MTELRIKPLSAEEAMGWASRLMELKKGYSVTSTNIPFGGLEHLVSKGGERITLKQGSSRALRSEVDASKPQVQAMIQDLHAIGAIFPVKEADSWSL